MILVTGACGNAGRYVVKKLLENGMDVIGVDINNVRTRTVAKQLNQSAKANQRQFKMCWDDFTKHDQVDNELELCFKNNPLTGVVHLAFIIPPWSDLKADYAEKVNISGTKQLIDCTEKYAPNIPFVFSSSTTVFGPIGENEIYINENHPTKATSNYTRQKLLCEEMFKNSKLDWRILRFSAIMNPVFDPDKESIKLGVHISLKVHIEPVHVQDVATAVYHALIRPQASHRVFIVSGGKCTQMTYKEYIHQLLNGVVGNVTVQDIPWNKFIDKEYFLHWYDTTESQAILTYQSRSMDDFIKDARAIIPGWKKLILKFFGKKLALKHFFPD